VPIRIYGLGRFIYYNPVIQGYYDLRIAICGVKVRGVARKTHCILPLMVILQQ
jgi:hypothetical protein